MKPRTLKKSLLLYFILFTTIPLIVATSVIIFQMYQSKKESVLYKHQQILKIVEEEADNIVSSIEHLGDYIKNRYPQKQHSVLTGLSQIREDVATILILDNNGILKDFGSKKNLKIYKGYDYSNMEYFKVIKTGKDQYWSKVYFSYASNTPSISYVQRVDKDNIVVIVIDLSMLNNFAKKFKNRDGTSMVRIIDKNGIFLAHPDRPEYIYERKNILNSDIYKKYIKANYEYKQIIFYNKDHIKSIGVYGVSNKLGWYIVVKEDYGKVFQAFNKVILFIVLFIVLLLIISIVTSLKLSKSILKPIDEFNTKMDEIAHGNYVTKIESAEYEELEKLSSNFLIMQEKIKLREEQNREKDKQIFESIKMVQMGEMIGNIAHQWRQPLSVISTAASGMKIEREFGILQDEKLYTYCDSITTSTQYLSDTIDTFRNFIKEKKERKEFILQDRINNALEIISSSLANHHIKLINNINYDHPVKITLVAGELSQVIINIINNAKDAIMEKKIEDPYVQISLNFDQEGMVTIVIEDNGGGIDENIINKIFDPYFTTKHQSQGTGLGLHMSYKIITESLKGSLSAKNTKDGVAFMISLPL